MRRTPRSIVIAVPATPEPRRIEGAAAYVWEALDTPRDADDIVAALRPLIGEPTIDLESETARTLQALAQAGLVECA